MIGDRADRFVLGVVTNKLFLLSAPVSLLNLPVLSCPVGVVILLVATLFDNVAAPPPFILGDIDLLLQVYLKYLYQVLVPLQCIQ